jgi:glyoxylase-like metal-dependent hydrolase (beta-lactamase superfamily II)
MRWVPPDITFTKQMSLFWGGPEIVLEHHPGPTPGACWAIIPAEKVIFVGDTVAVNQPAFFAHADLEAWLLKLDILKKTYSSYQVIAGRGGLASKQAIAEQYQSIKNVVKGVDKLVKRGSGPDATEDLVPGLLSNFSYDRDLKEIYTQRLKYGLYQYYARNYRPSSSLEQAIEEDTES